MKLILLKPHLFNWNTQKFLKPYCAAILNISKDHLDWHGTKKNI